MLCIMLLLGACSRSAELKIEASDETSVSELSEGLMDTAWKDSITILREILDQQAWCTLKGLYTRHSHSLSREECSAIRTDCMKKERFSIPGTRRNQIRDAIASHCSASVAETVECFNDFMKTLNRGLKSIDCTTDAVTLDRKLGVPDSCRRIENTCIMPVLVALVREGWE